MGLELPPKLTQNRKILKIYLHTYTNVTIALIYNALVSVCYLH